MLLKLLQRLWSVFDREKLQKLLMRFAPFAFLLILGYYSLPILTFAGIDSIPYPQSSYVKDFSDGVKASVQGVSSTNNGNGKQPVVFRPSCTQCTDYATTRISLTPLVGLLVKVPVIVFNDLHSMQVQTVEVYTLYYWDRLFLFIFMALGILLGLRALSTTTPTHVFERSNEQTTEAFAKKSRFAGLTAEEYLISDVERAEDRAKDMYRRSTILLAGGIVMAFVGVALFYVTVQSSDSYSELNLRYVAQRQDQQIRELNTELLYLLRNQEREIGERPGPTSSRDDRGSVDDTAPFATRPAPEHVNPSDDHPWLIFASHSLRPTGMLIFMEGIAWFLLRQYRVLIQEYKAFLQVYLRRSSYLIAWKASVSGAGDRQVAIANLMVNDLNTGAVLRKDETTEALETMRMADPTPVVEVLREMKNLVPNVKGLTSGTSQASDSHEK